MSDDVEHVDDEARALIEAAEIASAAAGELRAQLAIMKTIVDDAKTAQRDVKPARPDVDALLLQAGRQVEEVGHVVRRFEDLHRKVPGTVIELKATSRTLKAVVKGLRRHRRTFGQAALFQGAVEFQYGSLTRYMHLVVPEKHGSRPELESCLTSAKDAITAMKEAVGVVGSAIGADSS